MGKSSLTNRKCSNLNARSDTPHLIDKGCVRERLLNGELHESLERTAEQFQGRVCLKVGIPPNLFILTIPIHGEPDALIQDSRPAIPENGGPTLFSQTPRIVAKITGQVGVQNQDCAASLLSLWHRHLESPGYLIRFFIQQWTTPVSTLPGDSPEMPSCPVYRVRMVLGPQGNADESRLKFAILLLDSRMEENGLGTADHEKARAAISVGAALALLLRTGLTDIEYKINEVRTPTRIVRALRIERTSHPLGTPIQQHQTRFEVKQIFRRQTTLIWEIRTDLLSVDLRVLQIVHSETNLVAPAGIPTVLDSLPQNQIIGSTVRSSQQLEETLSSHSTSCRYGFRIQVKARHQDTSIRNFWYTAPAAFSPSFSSSRLPRSIS